MTKLSDDQKNAIEQLYLWYKKQNTTFITLGGYAGTGKTTTISMFRKLLYRYFENINVALCSYTGRASRILERTLNYHKALFPKDNVSTIHSLIYQPIENSKKEIVGWKKKDIINYELIIVDESSMIDENLWNDLQSYKIPIIAVGDHGQLPPISSQFDLMKNPLITLTNIHRQNMNNPIITMSRIVRENANLPAKIYGKYAVKYNLNDFDTKDILNNYLEQYDDSTLILTGFNKTRVNLNNFIRSQKLFDDPNPQINDKVICLKNNHTKKIYNGMIGKIQHIQKHDDNWFNADINFEGDQKYSGLIYKPQFNQKTTLNFTSERKKLINGDLFDFGYATTVHKAQGSEADKVILFEERTKHMDDAMWARWLYTGITRAKKELYVFGV